MLSKKFAIVFVPYVQTTKTLPLAPAIIKSILVSNGATNVDFCDANLRWHHYLETLPDASRQELFNFSQSVTVFPLSAESAEHYWNWVNSIVDELVSSDPAYIFISVFSFLGHKFTEDVCYYVRQRLPNAKIIVGGPGINSWLSDHKVMWYQQLVESELADTACIGDAEVTLMTAITASEKVIFADQQSNKALTASPAPDVSVYGDFYKYSHDLSNLSLPITFSKGCVKKCVFCDVEAQWPKFRVAAGGVTANKITDIAKDSPIRQFYFTDNLVNGNCKELQKLCTTLISNNVNVELTGNFIFRSRRDMPPEHFAAMAAAGFKTVFIGLESGSPRVRAAMKKGFTSEDFEYTVDQLYTNSIKQSWNIFVGFPTETDDDFALTLKTIDEYSKKLGPLLEITPIGLFQAITGSPIVTQNLFDLQHEYVNGHTEVNWVTPINPENTLTARISRWESLLRLLAQHNNSTRTAEKTMHLTKFYKQQLHESKNTTKFISIKQQTA